RGTADFADLRTVADPQFNVAFEDEAALDHGARADHDAHRPVVAPVEPAACFLHANAFVDTRIGTDLDVAADGADAAANVRTAQADAAVDVGHIATDLAAFIEQQRTVDGVDGFTDARTLAKRDAAIDGAGGMDAGVVANLDRTIHRGQLLGLAMPAQGDRTVDRIEIAGALAFVNAD